MSLTPSPTDLTRSPEVGAVIPVYNPGDRLVESVKMLVPRVTEVVVVVDEAPVSQGTAALVEECRLAGATVLHHDTNRGIGAALNSGWNALVGSFPDVRYVLTLDQDSLLPDRYVAQLLHAGARASTEGVRVGMVAPDSVASVAQDRRPAADRGPEGVVLGGEPIQSGLLIPRAVLERLGGFDEGLFIDGVDSDFFLRCRSAGLQSVVAGGTRIQHRLGTPLTIRGGRPLPFVVAADFRYYYQWRNLLLLLRRHLRRHPAWALRATGRLVRHLLIVTVLAPGRASRLRYVAAGVRDGLRGRRGRYSDRSLRRR